MTAAATSWSDPPGRAQALRQCAATEAAAMRDLLAAARYLDDPELRRELRHHAAAAAQNAAGLTACAGGATGEPLDPPAAPQQHPFDLSRDRPDELGRHGFYTAERCRDLDDVECLVMLEDAADRAARLFAQHSAACPEAATGTVLTAVAASKRSIATATANALSRIAASGRADEVRRARKNARHSRFRRSFERLGMRSGAGFSRFALMLLYWSLLLPFGLLSRLSPQPAANDKIRTGDPHRQY